MIKNSKINNKIYHIMHELKHHAPFTALSTIFAIFIIGTFKTILVSDANDMTIFKSDDLFHTFHILHILFSASATTAMFWRYERKLFKSVIIGMIGSLIICGLSDFLFPFLGGRFFGVEMELHWCLLLHPEAIVPFAIFGVFIGIKAEDLLKNRMATIFSHSLHILISSMATLLYLISFGFTAWFSHLPIMFLIIFVAVIIPCCVSDIVLPLFVNKEIKFLNRANPMGYDH